MAKLTLEVRETLHGHTYINTDAPGLDFLSAKGHQLAEVNRDRELVAGSITLLPGEQTVAFYGNRHFGFNANVFVDVSYDGVELGRVIFKVRPLPTYVIGGITDQFGQPVAGVTVSIPEINRTTETNADGGYAFGFQETADKVIPGGRYRMEINVNGKAPGFGTQTKSINLQQGRKNEVGVTRLQELNRNVTYQQIQGGQNVILAEGELEIDLTNAQLQFENGRRTGNIHTQFLSYEQFTTSVAPGALPLWLFAIQPRGTVVEGPLVATFTMPKLSNSYDYIPPGTDYVVLLGYNPESEIIEPVGVGRIENYQVISEGNVNYQSLDYFGYAIVDLALQPSLKAVAEGTKSMQQLKAELR